jgi:hypothetical protein
MAPLGGYVPPEVQGLTTLKSSLMTITLQSIERIIRGHKYLATAITIDKASWIHSGALRGSTSGAAHARWLGHLE